MGREIRKVPKGWQHPKDERGRFKPMFAESYEKVMQAWWDNHQLWLQGKHPDQEKYKEETRGIKFFAGWDGNSPALEHYNPNTWTEEEACCLQVYENVSEGTPISPVFASLLQVERWLAENGYSQEAVRELRQRGSLPTLVGRIEASKAGPLTGAAGKKNTGGRKDTLPEKSRKAGRGSKRQ